MAIDHESMTMAPPSCNRNRVDKVRMARDKIVVDMFDLIRIARWPQERCGTDSGSGDDA